MEIGTSFLNQLLNEIILSNYGLIKKRYRLCRIFEQKLRRSRKMCSVAARMTMTKVSQLCEGSVLFGPCEDEMVFICLDILNFRRGTRDGVNSESVLRPLVENRTVALPENPPTTPPCLLYTSDAPTRRTV